MPKQYRWIGDAPQWAQTKGPSPNGVTEMPLFELRELVPSSVWFRFGARHMTHMGCTKRL